MGEAPALGRPRACEWAGIPAPPSLRHNDRPARRSGPATIPGSDRTADPWPSPGIVRRSGFCSALRARREPPYTPGTPCPRSLATADRLADTPGGEDHG